MNPAQQQPETDLSTTLERQAARFTERGGSPLEFEQVLARAGEIRRGRRMRATMAMAAVVLAVAVPIGVVAVTTDDPTAPDSPLIAAQPDPSPVRLGNYDLGAAPKNGYAFADALYGAGEPIRLGTRGEIPFIGRLTSGFLLGQYADQYGGLKTTFVGNDGTVGDSWATESSLVVSADRTVGAFVDNNNDVIAVQNGGESFNLGTLPPGVGYQVQAVVGEDCSPAAPAGGCTVYAQVNSETAPYSRIWRISPGQDATPALDGYLTLAGVSVDGLTAGMISAADEGSCWQVRDSEGARQWKTCKNSLFSFSPDGKYLLAGPAYLDGPGGGGVTILDARTGATVLDLAAVQGAFVSDPRWEDSTHVLAPVYDNGMWAVERIGLDGNREYATEKAPDQDSYVSPFKLG